tara:strand:- start:376 stop:477 length:102 start_codon:yes stop_codon:yes gene_type:complete
MGIALMLRIKSWVLAIQARAALLEFEVLTQLVL